MKIERIIFDAYNFSSDICKCIDAIIDNVGVNNISADKYFKCYDEIKKLYGYLDSKMLPNVEFIDNYISTTKILKQLRRFIND